MAEPFAIVAGAPACNLQQRWDEKAYLECSAVPGTFGA
jgi:hypothetical protein